MSWASHSQANHVGHILHRLPGATASATRARVPCCGCPSRVGAMVPTRFMHVAVFQATHVSSCEVLRLAFSAAMQRAPLRRAAHDKMSSLHTGACARAGWVGHAWRPGAFLPAPPLPPPPTQTQHSHTPEEQRDDGGGDGRLGLQGLRCRGDGTDHHAFHALRADERLHVAGKAEWHGLVAALQLEAGVVGGDEVGVGERAHAAGHQQLAGRAPGQKQHVARHGWKEGDGGRVGYVKARPSCLGCLPTAP